MNDAATSSGPIEAVVLDLDGVVTDTASIHEEAWKQTFDPVLQTRGQPAFTHEDYLDHVDGKPRHDGVRDLLGARGIELEEAELRAIGDRKNERFLALLGARGADVFDDARAALERWRRAGLRTAMVSSSRNARRVVESAGLSELFDAFVDGEVAEAEGLAGKPAPDTFEEAARRIGVPPSRAAVLEDAISGVEAGARGGFAKVVGVARGPGGDVLAQHGADVVVRSLSTLDFAGRSARPARPARDLPPLLDCAHVVDEELSARRPVFFFDYDGTLSPIVDRPEDATLSEAMREALAKLAEAHTVAVVSGRGLADVRERVGLDGIVYAGSHGFEVEGPDLRLEHDAAAEATPRLAKAREGLEEALGGLEGVQIEPKEVAIAVHYRRASEADAARAVEVTERIAEGTDGLRATGGKKIVELRPDVDWDKGRALRWLLERVGEGDDDGGSAMPVYVGDDLTDEDAFGAIGDDGLAVLVGDHGDLTRAHYRLDDVEATRRWIEHLGGGGAATEGRTEVQDGDSWTLVYERYEPDQQPLREALCTLGNGYFATRGAAAEEAAGGSHYPGTYLAGGYDRQQTYLAERWVENEDLVNWPNWLPLSFRPEGGRWLSLDTVRIESFRQALDLRHGVLERRVRVRDADDRETELVSRRLVHMRFSHLAAEHWTLTPRNWSGRVHVRSWIDGSVINSGVARYRDLEGRHHEVLETGAVGEDTVHLTVRTLQSKLRMGQAIRTRVRSEGQPVAVERERLDGEGRVGHELSFDVALGHAVEVEKVLGLHTSRDRAITEPTVEAVDEVQRAGGFEALLASHRRAWDELWRRCDLELGVDDPSVERTARLHVFHLLQSVSPHSIDLDVGVTSRGLHGEAYRGHVFWDELFIFPLLNLRLPEITRALLMYRYRRLPQARRAARRSGLEGAMYPWQSGSNGREESQDVHLNPESGRWIPDETHLQRHVNAAIAYNVWQYFQATRDREFLSFHGAEMVLEIARFWASLATFDRADERYHIRGVVGPDEFHTRYPDAEEPGLDDNAYTNLMAAWTLRCAGWVLDQIDPDRVDELLAHLGMEHDDLERFEEVSRRMYVPYLDASRGLLAQFEGYGDLEELDWAAMREEHGNIQRLDRILEAEGDRVDRYQASKQADVLMLFYLLSTDQLRSLFEHLEQPFDPAMIPRNIEYYSGRTSHGSSLSRVVYAWVLARSDRRRSWSLFEEALRSDLDDIQGGTTPEGIHLGAMSGTVDLLQRCYGGVEMRDEGLWIEPSLPPELPRLRMRVRYRGQWLDLDISCEEITVSARRGWGPPLEVGVAGELHTFEPGEHRTFELRRG
ncbi:MAG TPA: trehalose-phosphatase [Sandaracinaceae bacterium LLY-WYZ-13_1]|nr:trehalose-phosphatase [Sandaracinaceae bacterium LLY-WYZ-13_1]